MKVQNQREAARMRQEAAKLTVAEAQRMLNMAYNYAAATQLAEMRAKLEALGNQLVVEAVSSSFSEQRDVMLAFAGQVHKIARG